jgi:hypothetical protein
LVSEEARSSGTMGALFSGAEFLQIAGIPAAVWPISARRACARRHGKLLQNVSITACFCALCAGNVMSLPD